MHNTTKNQNLPSHNPTTLTKTMSRRRSLKLGMASLGFALGTPLIGGCYRIDPSLNDPDANGLALPDGFRSRVVARSGEEVVPGFRWHGSPDGGAVFDLPDGGWIYVSNAELDYGNGGVGAIRFDREGNIIDGYSILSNTSRNCAGGKTPWGTWLSCEEVGFGAVYECDPLGGDPVIRPALGRFWHEAVAVDDDRQQLYLTEDAEDGGLYRFTPTDYPDLSEGLLEIAQMIDDGEAGTKLIWHTVPDPSGGYDSGSQRPDAANATRYQVPESSGFNGGEGIEYSDGLIYFTTKGDNRVWCYDCTSAEITIFYDPQTSTHPILAGVDNLTIAQSGDIYVAEDGDDMQIVALSPNGEVRPIVQVDRHPFSEVTGPAFDATGTRLYFSSQRGSSGHWLSGGVTYEVIGPFYEA